MNPDNLVGCCGNVDLQFACFIEGTVEQREKTLMCDIGSVFGRISFESVADILGVIFAVE
jgi:hypothetical protein